HLDLYGFEDQHPRGAVFVAGLGIEGEATEEDGRVASTEDDAAGSLPGFPLSLQRHSADVETKAEKFAHACGLPADRTIDLKIAGYLHDFGKADPRFQAWLHYGDPLGWDITDPIDVLAKSGRFVPANVRQASGLPQNWR